MAQLIAGRRMRERTEVEAWVEQNYMGPMAHGVRRNRTGGG